MSRIILSFIIFLFVISSSILAQGDILSPDEFLPYKHGTKFTPHHLLVDYYQHVASNSANVILEEYGRTNEDRPLMIAIVSSETNLNNLEAIRKENLINAGIENGASSTSNQKSIVWLSFSVHGNEAAGSESAVPVLYDLVTNPKCKEWLENTIIILDPSINPDGYSRYTHWNRRMSNSIPQADDNAIEHHEPWPGGRSNHYFHDLNRDWAWITQVESQQRLPKFRSWLPHVHADLHEMGYNSPYYFAPAAQPYHEYITQFQRDFQFDIGKNHASYFDKEGWQYFTREVFDLLYPSYGDTYPTYNGSIGMTYEQGGSGRAGLGIHMNNDDLLTLADRIAHHKTTALSTIEVASKNQDILVSNFKKYFDEAQNNPPGKYKSFIIKRTGHPDALERFLGLLDAHGIAYGIAEKSGSKVGAFGYKLGKQTTVNLAEDDIIISAYQPMGKLAQILLEPEPGLVDSLTYDITAWSLIYAYGLDGYASTQRMTPGSKPAMATAMIKNQPAADQKTLMVRWGGLKAVQFLSSAIQAGIRVRTNPEVIVQGKERYEPGTLIISYADNKFLGNAFSKTIADIGTKHGVAVHSTSSGFFDKGPDVGSGKMTQLGLPKIMVLTDDGTSSLSYGQIWNYFDKTINFPTVNIDVDDFGRVDLSEYDLVIMPEGWYSQLGDGDLASLKDFVRSGGKLIAIGSAVRKLDGDAGFGLETYVTEENKSNDDEIAEQRRMNARLDHFEDRLRASINNEIPGAITKLTLDTSHPLGYGMSSTYHSLKTSGLNYELQTDAWNVGHLPDNFQSYGFIGANVKEKMDDTAVFIHKSMGRGDVLFLIDNPLYRSFWHQGILLFSNAVFQVK